MPVVEVAVHEQLHKAQVEPVVVEQVDKQGLMERLVLQILAVAEGVVQQALILMVALAALVLSSSN
jgi:hypothetical protein